MGASQNFNSKSIVLPSRRSRIERLNGPLLRTANKETLDPKRAVLLHVNIRDLQVPVWLSVIDELAVDILVGSSVIDRYRRDILPSIQRITLRNP